jgi:hypothetical protein
LLYRLSISTTTLSILSSALDSKGAVVCQLHPCLV